MNKKEFNETYKDFCADLRYELEEQAVFDVTMIPVKLMGMDKAYDGLLLSNERGAQTTVDLTIIGEVHEKHDLYFDEVERIADAVADALHTDGKITLGEVGDYESIKDHLKLCALSTERNAEFLQTVPHFEIEDISIIFKVDLGNVEGNHPTVTITNKTLEIMGISKEQLYIDAMKQVPKQDPAFLVGMSEYLGATQGIDPDLLRGGDDERFFMMMPQSGFNGSGILAYPGIMEQVSNQVGGDFFVLPSSVHEILIVPDNGLADLEVLKLMVKEINEQEVSPEDQLSDHVYHYDSNERLFEIDDRYEARQEAEREGLNSLLESLDAKKQGIVGKNADRALDAKVKKMEETQ